MTRLFGSDKLPPGIHRLFRLPWTRREVRRDLDDELQFHIQMRIDELRAHGMPEQEAEAEARRRLGDERDLKTYCLRVDERRALADRAIMWIQDLAQDLRLALRQIRRSPGFTALAVCTLAIGIAVVTATFSFVNTALYRALPYPLANRSVAIIASPFAHYGNLPGPAVNMLRHDAHAFERVSAFYDVGARFELDNHVKSLVGTAVDTGFFATLGARPERGRFPTAAEVAESTPYAVISHRMWNSELNADPDIVGRSLRFGTHLYTVVGVMPPHINYGSAGRTDVWIPQPAVADTGSYYFAFAWLRPGVTLARARAEVATISAQLVRSDSSRYRRLDMYVNNEMVVRGMEVQGRALMLFFVVAACVLLIACANIATLMLMRATGRRREMAVRASLGAGRARLLRQSLTESFVLAAIASAVGIALSVVCIRLTAWAFPTGFGTWFRLGIDSHVLLFVIGVSAAVVFLVGLTPARYGTRVDISAMLKAGGIGSTSAHTLRRGQRSIGIQVAVAVALLVNALLLGASYRNTTNIDRGFNPKGVIAVQLLRGPNRNALARQLTDALAQNATILSAARVDDFRQFQDSTLGANLTDSIFRTDVATAITVGGQPGIQTHIVSDNYFSTLGIPLLRGHSFAVADTAGRPIVAVVSERMATAIWGGRGDVGRTFRLGRNGPVITVIGVAGDVRDLMPTSQSGPHLTRFPDVYFSDRQATGLGHAQVLVRAAAGQGATIAAINNDIRIAVPQLDAFAVRPYIETLSEFPEILRAFGGVIWTCAAIAFGLSLVGIYGVVGYSVAQRTREIGIRIALGGSVAEVRRHVMRGSLRVTAVGMVIGILLALGLGRVLQTWMLGVSPTSVTLYLAACILFMGAAFFAGYFPSRRAARVDPAKALRAE